MFNIEKPENYSSIPLFKRWIVLSRMAFLLGTANHVHNAFLMSEYWNGNMHNFVKLL